MNINMDSRSVWTSTAFQKPEFSKKKTNSPYNRQFDEYSEYHKVINKSTSFHETITDENVSLYH